MTDNNSIVDVSSQKFGVWSRLRKVAALIMITMLNLANLARGDGSAALITIAQIRRRETTPKGDGVYYYQ